MTDFGNHHADQIVQAHRRLDAHDMRLNQMEISHAREAERSAHIQRSLGEIQESVKWVTRIILGAILGAIVAFVIGGGLHV